MTRLRFAPLALLLVLLVGLLSACSGKGPEGTVPPLEPASGDAGDEPARAVLRVTAKDDLRTTEAGERATFTVALGLRPIADVVVPIVSSAPAEVTAQPTALTFGPSDWDRPKTVTLLGNDDLVADGDQTVTVTVGPTSSADTAWNGVKTEPVTVVNADDDVAGVDVSLPSPTNNVTENGAAATFTVRLRSKPTAPVTIAVSSTAAAEGKPDKTQLVFGPDTWQLAQTVEVKGQDDSVADGDEPFDIVLGKPQTTDAAYQALGETRVSFLNLDDDIPGFFVFPPAVDQRKTTEGGGTASFGVRLRSKPTSDVTIAVTSTKPTEGQPNVAQLVFTPTTYATVQTVTVTGKDDAIDDGDQAFAITLGAAASADTSYAGLNPPDVDLTNVDDDTAGILVGQPVPTSMTTEGGGAITFTVKLASQPTAAVTIGVSSSKPAEGVADATELSFDAASWNVPKTVTVAGKDDPVDDGNVAYAIVLAKATSADPKYAAIDPPDVLLTNVDDDTAGVSVGAPSPVAQTSEGGAKVTVAVVLQTKPTGDVTIPVSVSNAAEATVDTASLLFKPADWDQPQIITVTGKDDDVDDGDVAYSLVLGAATGGGYAGIDPADVALTNLDDDVASITVGAPSPSNETTEAGGKVTVEVVLTSQPTANVTIPVSVSNAFEATADTNLLTFTPTTWKIPQIITVTGKSDAVDDGDVAYTLVLGAATGGGYTGIDPADVPLTNVDDDAVGIVVTPPAVAETTEAGGSVVITVVLQSEPTSDVTIPVSVSNTDEATADKTELMFTAANWNVPQTITVTGKDDAVDDGDVAYWLVLGAATGGDYAGLDPADVALTNKDDDEPPP